MQNTHTNIVYNYLLQNSNSKRTAASIAANTQLTTQQVSGALQNLQKRKLVVVTYQQHKRNTYSAVTAHTAQAVAHIAAAHVAQQRTSTKQLTLMQRIVRAVKLVFAK